MNIHIVLQKFVRKILALPHPSSIRAWGASVDCSPGYLTNVIEMLGTAVAKKSWMSDVVLIVDAMSLRKGTTMVSTYFGTIEKTSHFKASLHFHHALYNTGIVLIVFVSLRAFI